MPARVPVFFFVMGKLIKAKTKDLTPKQENFCRARVAGLTQRKAYQKAYNSKSIQSADHNGYDLDHTDKIIERIKQLQAQVDGGAILDGKQIQTMLSDMASDENKPDAIRLKASDQLSRMQGLYSDNVQISSNTLLTIEDKRALFREMMQENG